MMKLRIALVLPTLVLTAIAVTGCGQKGSGAGQSNGWPANRTFLSTSVTEKNHDRPLVAGTRIELTFSADGKVGGQAGCNHLGGDAHLDGGKLIVGDIAMTDMGCDAGRGAQDSWLVAFLGAKPAFALTGDKLVLTGGDVEIRLTDRTTVDPDRPLAATTWVVDTILSGQTASSLPAGAAEAYLVFDGAGLFSGFTGCAHVEGTAQVRDGKITFGSPDGFGATCAGSGALRTAMDGALLHGPVTYTIVATHLTLTGPTGAGLGLHAK
jgi:heat shock protein HslJ